MEDKHTHIEPHHSNNSQKLNWLRAGVLGANDGIISIAGLVIGVASATNSHIVILTAGLAGIIAGAISMAAGEYVSVSSSRDSEKALLKIEEYELKNYPKGERKKVFDRFFRVKGKKENSASGLGLGLYISYEIINQHGGKIWLESEENKGSTFNFSLPIKEQKSM